MSVAVRCPACQAQLRIPETAIGKSIRCRECNKPFVATTGGYASGSRTLLYIVLSVALLAAVLAAILRLAHVI